MRISRSYQIVPIADPLCSLGLLLERGSGWSGIRQEATKMSCPHFRATRTAFYIGAWYCISITMTLYNKWLFSVYGLRLPLTITSLHILLKIPASRLAMCLTGLPPVRFDRASRRVLACEVMPSGLTTAADIACSNLALLYITV